MPDILSRRTEIAVGLEGLLRIECRASGHIRNQNRSSAIQQEGDKKTRYWCLPTSGRAEAIEIQADARHVEIRIHQLNLQSAKSLSTPGVKSTTSDIVPVFPLEKHTPF